MTLKKTLIVFIILLVLAFAGFMLFRGAILENALSRIQQKVADRYHLKVTYREAGFEGLFRVAINDLSLIPASGDTLFYSKKTALNISLLRFLKRQPPINNFLLEEGFIHLVDKNDSTNNYSMLFNRKSQDGDENAERDSVRSYSAAIENLWDKFFNVVDLNFNVTDFNIAWKNDSISESVFISDCNLNKSILKMKAVDKQPTTENNWELMGIIDPGNEIIDMHIATTGNKFARIPFIEKISGIRFYLNSVGISLSLNKESKHTLRFNLNAGCVAPAINHWRISPEDVVLDSVGASLQVYVNDTAIYTGEESRFIINQLPLITHLSYSRNTQKRIAANVDIPEIEASAFFNSLPSGLFYAVSGIKVKGKISYHLKMDVNLDNPDNLIFDSELKKSDFRILSYGNENFASINNTFTYTARENDKVVRVFQVGPENPMFTPLQDITPMLIGSVLTAEDGTFYFHKGFNEDAFRESIATNIKEKRFARGGSTISMQLVKNVFLNRNKTISRKVEEALIVWLIENNGIVSKSRMLEVYLNIIEWGPGIYGIGEAADFYFSKKPSQLNLEECIFLSSIIPKPKYFMYSFSKNGLLKDYLQSYFQLVAGRLLKKEYIQQSDFDQLKYQVELKGRARQFVVPADSIPADSLMHDLPDELF